MPFALVTIGLVMIVTGARDTYGALGAQLRGDFTGPGNFTYWLASIGVVGSIGYIEDLRTFSRAFMALIIISFVLKNGGFFDKFKSALASGPTAPAVNQAATASAAPSAGGSAPLIDAGPLGTFNPQLTPGGPAAGVVDWLSNGPLTQFHQWLFGR